MTFLSINGCGVHHKFDLDSFRDIPANTLRFNSNHSQTVDSIFIFDTGRNITATGNRIYEITTYAERRKADSLLEISKNEKFPSPFAPTTSYRPYLFDEKTFFVITVYDSLGFEYTKLLEKELLPGEYLVNFAIYSVLKQGTYYIETKSRKQKHLNKLIII